MKFKYFSEFYADMCNVRLIHHGLASDNRRLELMIEMMDYADSRFSLDLMLVKTNQIAYFEKLKKMVQLRKNVRLIPPVEFHEIIPFISQYDLGIFICPPTTFNLEHCLPNKFFEYIQAHLAIAISPNPEMARIVQKEKLGIVSRDYSPKSLIKALNAMTQEDLINYRRASKKAAKIYNADLSAKKLLELIEGLRQAK